MVGSIDPRCETVRGTHWPKKVAWLFGARVAETILASGPKSPHQQAGHMDASDPIRPSKKLLRHGGRPHMGPGVLAQQGIKLRLDRTDRNEIAAGAFIDTIEMRAAVEEIALARFGPSARGGHVEEHRHQRRGAVAHRGIHHLSLA